MKQMIDQNQCTGCGNCISFCPKQLLSLSESGNLNERGVRYIQINDKEACIQCGRCELMCTAGAIQIEKYANNGYELINKKLIPPHAGCYLGSLSKALADCIAKLNIQKDVVIFKKSAADVNLNVETYDYQDEQFYEDGLAYKRANPHKLVILICSSSKSHTTAVNEERFRALSTENVTLINTLNWFEIDEEFNLKCGGSRILEEVSKQGNASFVARGSVRSPQDMMNLERYLEQAIQNQIDKKAYSIVEIVFPCFYRLANRPQVLMPYEEINVLNKWFDKTVASAYGEGILHK